MFLEDFRMPLDGLPDFTPLRSRGNASSERYRVDNEYGRLEAVLMADPSQLDLVSCNSVSDEAIRSGRRCRPAEARRQHSALSTILRGEGVEVRVMPAEPGLPDLAFTRDTSLMSPWGLIGLRPGAAHRVAEVDAVMAAARSAVIPVLDRIHEGRIEGGDVAMIRPGLLAIGVSGDRTDQAGADALADLYRGRGWQVITCRVDPHFLHLDTIFCMVDDGLALACTDVLDDLFLGRIRELGVELVPVSYKEVRRLGCNLLSIGDRRVVTPGTCPRVDAELAMRGFRCLGVDLSEFTMCGGGVHCLTMPLRRARA